MTTETANALIEVAKILMDKTYRLPPIGAQSSLTLFSEQSRKETFTVHINRKARIDPGKYTLLLSVPEEGLLRIDVHGRDHINPDGSKVPCPHIHMRIKDTGKWDVWAYDLPSVFGDSEDIVITLRDFLQYCNTNNIDQLEIIEQKELADHGNGNGFH